MSRLSTSTDAAPPARDVVVRELQATIHQLQAANADLQRRLADAEERAERARLDFLDAARRAARLELRLTEARGGDPDGRTLPTHRPEQPAGAAAPAPVRRGDPDLETMPDIRPMDERRRRAVL